MRLRLAIAFLFVSAIASSVAAGTIFLAGQRIEFDTKLSPRFTRRQIRATTEATRAGLAQLARTKRGSELLAYLTSGAYEIDVTEVFSNEEAGDAPEPGLATLLASGDRRIVKKYSIAINPMSIALPEGIIALAGQPSSAADGTAAAWGAELLHVYFYSRGIRLPHHSRDDFQQEWHTLAVQLGFPTLEHGEAKEPE